MPRELPESPGSVCKESKRAETRHRGRRAGLPGSHRYPGDLGDPGEGPIEHARSLSSH